jgi:Outer membrane lipoprotein-sorting protein
MRVHLILPSMLILATASLRVLHAEQPTPTADEVVATMFAHDTLREAASGGYTGEREYVLDNHLFKKRAEMLVRVTCDRNGTKHFEVMSEDGWKSASKHVLRQMLVTESDSSHPDTRPRNRVTSDNYTFRMIQTTRLDGRTAYVIEAIPKREDKSLFRGRIWVDTEDYALARVEGEPAKNPSVWTRKVHFVQQYYKAGAFWYPMETTSVTDARVFGTTDVNIRYFDYMPVSNGPTVVPDYSMMEAHYANR